jgi:hypothetical protein
LTEFIREFRRITGIMRLTYEQKTSECNVIFGFFQRFCVLADIATDIYHVEGARVPYYVCSLSVRNYLEMQACLLEGAYHSAVRSLRWLYEANLVGATSCINPALLGDRVSDKPAMELEEFEDLLKRIDTGVRIDRKKIFDSFSLPTDDLQKLYSDLCKYVHLSTVSFDKTLDFPNLQYVPEKFDEIFPTIMKTLDLVFWMESKMCLCYDRGTSEALLYYVKDHDGLNKYVQMTISLISNL